MQVLGNDQVRISIGGQSIDVLSQVPLQAGQTLQLQVSQTSSGVELAVVSQQGASPGAASATAILDSVILAPGAAADIAALAAPGTIVVNPLTALETLTVSLAAEVAATQQTSLAPLFSNLGVAAGLTGLPPQVQQAVAQVLAQQTSLDTSLTGDDIKQAFQTSGLFLEASLASGTVSPSAAAPDLKAALIVLRQVLTTSLASATTPQGTPAVVTAVSQQAPSAVPSAATSRSSRRRCSSPPGPSGPGRNAGPARAPPPGTSTPCRCPPASSPASAALP